ncbi:unnamed protein product, partial [Rotaria socialis]
INGQNHSDETDCEDWQCNNIYTRCDGFWSCPHGEDEENCTRSICPKDLLPCISLNRSVLICLPANQVGDGIIDCLGASDEIEYCRESNEHYRIRGFYCSNDRICVQHGELCNGNQDCLLGDDENVCAHRSQLCEKSNFHNLTDAEYVFCQIGSIMKPSFSLETASIYPPLPIVQINPVNNQLNEQYIYSSPGKFSQPNICNYGLQVYHWLGLDNISIVSFCPPNYYGDRCQFQNQRVSVTLRLGLVERQLPYTIVISLFEDENDRQEIYSYHQLTYLPKDGCGRSLSMYLLYSARPKNNSKNCSIHIDAFDKNSLTYIASWHLKVPFLFLPVNRLAVFLTLPISRTLHHSHCPLECYKGACVKYLNEEHFFVCVIPVGLVRNAIFRSIARTVRQTRSVLVPFKIDPSVFVHSSESTNISTTIGPAQRCVPYQELFSHELLTLPRIHRLNNYHVPCQNNVESQCFMDELYMCLCTVEHH